MLASYARASFRHPWRAVLVCVVVLAAMLAAIGVIGSSFDSQREIPSTESGDGFDVLEAHFGEFGSGLTGSIVFEAEAGARDPEVEAAMSALFEDVRAIDDVTLVSPYEPQGFRLISSTDSAPGTIAYAPITLDSSVDDNESGDIGAEIRNLIDDAGLNDTPGLRVEVGGYALSGFEPPEAETIGLAFAIVVLILALGSVVAMGTTVFVAVLGVGAGIGLMILLTNFVQIPDLAPTLGLMIGLGAGIDYALFIVTRYRESRGRGLDDESGRCCGARHRGAFSGLCRHDRRHLAARALLHRREVHSRGWVGGFGNRGDGRHQFDHSAACRLVAAGGSDRRHPMARHRHGRSGGHRTVGHRFRDSPLAGRRAPRIGGRRPRVDPRSSQPTVAAACAAGADTTAADPVVPPQPDSPEPPLVVRHRWCRPPSFVGLTGARPSASAFLMRAIWPRTPQLGRPMTFSPKGLVPVPMARCSSWPRWADPLIWRFSTGCRES